MFFVTRFVQLRIGGSVIPDSSPSGACLCVRVEVVASGKKTASISL